MTERLSISRKQVLRLFLLVASLSSPLALAQLNTAFTYQGNLSDTGGLANGDYDMEFELWDSLNAGNPLGNTVSFNDTPVQDGVYTLSIDFGAVPFSGDDRWLSIRIRDGASTGAFTTLLPRQPLTPAPYALHAEFVPADSITDLEIDSGSVQQRIIGNCAPGEAIRSIDANGNVSCEVDDAGTYSAGAGLILSAEEFSVDNTSIQARVVGTCPANEYIRSIAVDGSVVCEADDDSDTTYTAGNGLILNAQQFSVNSASVQSRVDGNCIPGTYLVGINSNGTVDCELMPFGFGFTLETGNVGNYSDIAIRNNGRPIISHEDDGTNGLGIYDCTNTTCTSGIARSVDNSGQFSGGRYTQIAVRANGLPIVSYYDATLKDLKVYDCTTSTCSAGVIRSLDTGGDVGENTGLAIRANDLPIISYYDRSNGDLKIYVCNNTSCSSGAPRTLDSTGDVGDPGTSIAIRDDDRPIISYYDRTNSDLKVYDCNDSACNSGIARTLNGGGSAGERSSIAIRNDGMPIISYRLRSVSDHLRIFDCTDVGCATGAARTLASGESTGLQSDIAIRPNGRPIITFTDYTFSTNRRELRLYDCFDAACTTGVDRLLDANGSVGFSPGIALRNFSALPIISYYDTTRSSLKTYNCVDGGCAK